MPARSPRLGRPSRNVSAATIFKNFGSGSSSLTARMLLNLSWISTALISPSISSTRCGCGAVQFRNPPPQAIAQAEPCATSVLPVPRHAYMSASDETPSQGASMFSRGGKSRCRNSVMLSAVTFCCPPGWTWHVAQNDGVAHGSRSHIWQITTTAPCATVQVAAFRHGTRPAPGCAGASATTSPCRSGAPRYATTHGRDVGGGAPARS